MTNFPMELRTFSFVHRWSVFWASRKDNLAEHSFFVSLYAYKVADIIGWTGDYAKLLIYALLHDADELLSGDIIGPAKRHMIDKIRAEEYIVGRLENVLGDFHVDILDVKADPAFEDMYLITKVADKIDDLMFLSVEKRMGNANAERLHQKLIGEVEAAWFNLTMVPEDLRGHLWHTVVKPQLLCNDMLGGMGPSW